MIINIVEGFKLLFTLQNILYLNLGLFLGIVVGAIPGLTGLLAITICMPLTFGMQAITGISLLLGIFVGGSYGGSITAILINTPGAPAAAATVLDGYPASQKGKTKKALDTSLYSSCFGGFISAIMLLFFSPQIAKVALKFGPADYFSLALFGISIISSVSGKNLMKGLISGALGIFIGSIGIDPNGIQRFTFGDYRLLGGVSFVVVLIGLFALSEVIINKNNKDIDHFSSIVKNEKEQGLTFREFLGLRNTLIRGTLIGAVIGAVPGTGGGIASFISYSQAKKHSKNSEEFGYGALEGIAAPEVANNATTGTALIPMMTLGIPGDAGTAIIMGAFMVHGLNPGPKLFVDQGDIVYAIILGLILTNMLLVIQGNLLVPFFERFAKIKYSYLSPIITAFCFAGAYSINNTIFDNYIIVVIALLSVFMHFLEIPRAPMLLGLILGNIIESNLLRALVISEGSLLIFITRPISLFFLVLAISSFALPVFKNVMIRRKGKQKS